MTTLRASHDALAAELADERVRRADLRGEHLRELQTLKEEWSEVVRGKEDELRQLRALLGEARKRLRVLRHELERALSGWGWYLPSPEFRLLLDDLAREDERDGVAGAGTSSGEVPGTGFASVRESIAARKAIEKTRAELARSATALKRTPVGGRSPSMATGAGVGAGRGPREFDEVESEDALLFRSGRTGRPLDAGYTSDDEVARLRARRADRGWVGRGSFGVAHDPHWTAATLPGWRPEGRTEARRDGSRR